MKAVGSAQVDEATLLELARGGDGDAFGELTGAYRSELRAHCYRMLGSVHDAEDALQEALLRAWRNLSGFQGRSSVRSWLYSIATNTALDITRHRSRRELPTDFGPPAGQGVELAAPVTDRPWLEPYPDQWLADDAGRSPEARYEQRESVELAFIIALQHLPPLQRAVLLLREVVGLSAEEIAGQLGTTTASVTSALQRARVTARGLLPSRSQQATLRALGDQRTRAIAERYASAMERADTDALIGMLTEDATWCMPPVPNWYRGHESIREWLAPGPLSVSWRHRPTRANGQLAVGCYLMDPGGGCYVPAVLDVLTLRGDKIAAVTAFLTALTVETEPTDPNPWIPGEELFARFGLPIKLTEKAD